LSTKAQKREQKKRRKRGSLNEIEYVCATALKKHSLHSRQRARAHPGSRRQLHRRRERTRVRSKRVRRRRERTSSSLLFPYFCCRWETPVFLNDERRREEEKVLFTLFVSRRRRGARREERRRRVWIHYIYTCVYVCRYVLRLESDANVVKRCFVSYFLNNSLTRINNP